MVTDFNFTSGRVKQNKVKIHFLFNQQVRTCVDCDDSVNKIMYLTHTDSEGLTPKYFGRSYKMPKVLADKIKHYFVKSR